MDEQWAALELVLPKGARAGGGRSSGLGGG